MKRALLAALLLAACGSDSKKPQADAGTSGPIDAPVAMPDAPVTQATLTSYVIDLVQHHTTATDAPRGYAEFSALPDPDGSNGSAYAPLFP